jgi:hypothetical protein
MAIEAVETEVKKRTKKDVPTVAAEPGQEMQAAERTLAAMYTEPQCTISRMTFSLDVTIPTGNYENLRPKIEITYDVPEGAIPPNEVEQLDILREQVSLFIFPLVEAQTAAINVKAMATQESEMKAKLEMAATWSASSPLFNWLKTFNRPLAGKLLSNRINYYKDMT